MSSTRYEGVGILKEKEKLIHFQIPEKRAMTETDFSFLPLLQKVGQL